MKLENLIKQFLTKDLLKPQYRGFHPLSGHCYVASEAYYHLRGGKAAGLHAVNLKHEGVSHWWVEDNERIVDITAAQFSSQVPYEKGRRRGFLTKKPSKRAQVVIDRVLERMKE
jgi:hypothetical protein